MPSIGFYLGVYFGFIAGMVLFFAATSSYIPENHNPTAAGIGVLLMLVFGSIAGVATFMDLRPMYREWNIKRKMQDMELEEQEQEVERRRQESRSYTQEQDTSPSQPSSESTKQSGPKAKTTNAKSPFQDTKTFEEIFGEEPILKTGGGVPSNLQKKTEEIESEEIPEPVEKESVQEEYVRYVKRDQILRGLWYLYSSKEGFFLGQTEAARIIFEIPENEKVSGSRREDIKATMNELEHYGLLAATVVKDDIKGKQLIEYKITPKGKDMMKRAVDENVRRWVDFVEKYKFDLKKGQ